MEYLHVTYRLDVAPDDAEARAEALAREQTVEVPRVVVRDRFVEENVLGRVEWVDPAGEGAPRARVAFPLPGTALDPAQLLNILFGLTALHGDVRCVELELPPTLLAALEGPRFGIEGLRKAVGVDDRALTCTAAKPLGLSPDALAGLVLDFGRAGLDVVKDDQGLADHDFCPFDERVRACLAAAERAADETGRRLLYVPNLIGTPDVVFRQLELAQRLGARAVMASPMLIGLPVFWELCHRHASVPVLAHPSFAGAQGCAPEVLFGTLLRCYGADAVIFVGYAGRFHVPRETCHDLARNLRAPLGDLLPALPVPGGGVEIGNAAELVSFYGRDAMLLSGGSLQLEEGRVVERGRAFVEAVREASAALPA